VLDFAFLIFGDVEMMWGIAQAEFTKDPLSNPSYRRKDKEEFVSPKEDRGRARKSGEQQGRLGTRANNTTVAGDFNQGGPQSPLRVSTSLEAGWQGETPYSFHSRSLSIIHVTTRTNIRSPEHCGAQLPYLHLV
jgi:hypothetical protein